MLRGRSKERAVGSNLPKRERLRGPDPRCVSVDGFLLFRSLSSQLFWEFPAPLRDSTSSSCFLVFQINRESSGELRGEAGEREGVRKKFSRGGAEARREGEAGSPGGAGVSPAFSDSCCSRVIRGSNPNRVSGRDSWIHGRGESPSSREEPMTRHQSTRERLRGASPHRGKLRAERSEGTS